jgi:hypothetical protein
MGWGQLSLSSPPGTQTTRGLGTQQSQHGYFGEDKNLLFVPAIERHWLLQSLPLTPIMCTYRDTSIPIPMSFLTATQLMAIPNFTNFTDTEEFLDQFPCTVSGVRSFPTPVKLRHIPRKIILLYPWVFLPLFFCVNFLKLGGNYIHRQIQHLILYFAHTVYLCVS